MRHAMLVMLTPALLLTGCQTDQVGGPRAGETESSPTLKASALPISGQCEGTFDFIPIDFLPPPLDDLAAHARLPFRGTCRVSHLGKSTTVGEDLVDFTGDPFVGTGTRVFVAANGDELWATEEVSTPAPGANPAFTTTTALTFTGGTGRFRDATGHADGSGGGSIEDNSNYLSFTGTLTVLRP